MSHGHDHHGHSHAPASFGRVFAISIILNTVFIIAEIIYGITSHSLALLADAGHNAGDVLSLFLAWGATYLARKKPSSRFTYGLSSSSIIAALANAVLLLVITGGICWEAVRRFSAPEPVAGNTVMIIAACRVLVNGISALLFMRGRKNDLNIRAAFLHLAGDAAISFGVIVSGFAIIKTGWLWLDPLTSLLVSLAIIITGWHLLRDSLRLSLHAVPEHIDYAKVMDFLKSQANVGEVHDLHIWAISTTEVALSAHLVMQTGHPGDDFLHDLSHKLHHDFEIGHSTIQLEIGDAETCELTSHN